MDQSEEFKFQNVAYRPTVYKTGEEENTKLWKRGGKNFEPAFLFSNYLASKWHKCTNFIRLLFRSEIPNFVNETCQKLILFLDSSIGLILWQCRVWRLQGRDTKLERFLAKNQLESNEIIEFWELEYTPSF